MRIGQGFDAHAFKAGRKLVIGGVAIPHAQDLEGHSDADELLHAVCDALIGAAALGDIGRHVPDSDPQYHGIESRKLLSETAALRARPCWGLGELDATSVAQEPRMSPHGPAMVANIAADLGAPLSDGSVKAKTSEKLGFPGRGEGIAAEAVALIAPLAGAKSRG